jgi:hypothetical protein
MKVKVNTWFTEVRACPETGGRIIDRSGFSLKDLSKSVSVGTRKMVNYA